MKADEIIIRPILSEKASLLRENKHKTYVFEVSRKSNKIDILRAIKEIFKVVPLSCSTVNVRGYKKANVPYRGSVKRGHGRTASWKKAYVVLPEGKSITELEA